MVTLDQIRAMVPGDVFYIRSKRYEVIEVVEHREGFMPTIRMRADFTRWTLVASQSNLSRITRIVPKDKTRKRTTRKNYEFVAAHLRPEGYETETNDCTVRALACAFGLPYSQAHAYLESHGRRKGRGTSCVVPYRKFTDGTSMLKEWSYADIQAASKLGIRTIGQWLKSGLLPPRCILRIRAHVFAVVDGVVMDSHRTGTRAQVYGIFEVVPQP